MKIEKHFSNTACEQHLTAEVTKTSVQCILTDYGETYSTMCRVCLTKRDILILKELPDNQAIQFVLTLVKKGKIKSTKIAHKSGRYWEDDLPR